jgi:hypothetical protein
MSLYRQKAVEDEVNSPRRATVLGLGGGPGQEELLPTNFVDVQ